MYGSTAFYLEFDSPYNTFSALVWIAKTTISWSSRMQPTARKVTDQSRNSFRKSISIHVPRDVFQEQTLGRNYRLSLRFKIRTQRTW
jgi:hypothetical protein